MNRDGLRVAVAVCAASLVFLYWNILGRLIEDWTNDDNYSHGFFIIPLAAYFLWERRDRLSSLTWRPTGLGLVAVGGGLLVLLAGLLGAELFLTRVSLVIVVGGAVLFLGGWSVLRTVAFPLTFLMLMIPIPAIIFNQIAFPLQLLASRFGETVLTSLDIPVLREGNVIHLARTTLEVAEACSGIRSLISLLTLGIVYGYFTDSRVWVRTVIALSTIPIAILTNAARVAGTGVAAHYYGEQAALGFLHTFSGWLVFVSAFILVFAVTWLVRRVAPPPRLPRPAEATV